MLQKTFFAEDMRKALRLVRDDMGAEAIILANKKVPGGVEVAAAISRETEESIPSVKVRSRSAQSGSETATVISNPSLAGASRPKQLIETKASRYVKEEQVLKAVAGDTLPVTTQEEERVSSGSVSAYEYYNSGQRTQHRDPAHNESRQELHPEDTKGNSSQPQMNEMAAPVSDEFDAMTERYEHELSEVKEQLDSLKSMLEQARNIPDPRVIRVKQKASSKLTQLGFSRAASEYITEQMADAESEAVGWKNTLAALSTEVECHQDEFNGRYGCFSFIGSPGVGKTTLITKLAIEHIQKYGREDLVLVTLDNQRLGASHQITHLGQLLQIPVFTGDKAERLLSRIEQAGKNKKILIDTAGVTAIDDYWLEQVHLLKKLPESSKTVLVVSCTQQLAVLNAMVQDYLLLDISGAVLTKADEATSIGEALSIVVENKLPVFAVGHSQRTSQPLLKIPGSTLVEMFVNKSRRWSVLNDLTSLSLKESNLEPSGEIEEETDNICMD